MRESWIILQNRDLDNSTQCNNHGLAWSTAHFALNGNNSNFAELGFSLHHDGLGNRVLYMVQPSRTAASISAKLLEPLRRAAGSAAPASVSGARRAMQALSTLASSACWRSTMPAIGRRGENIQLQEL
jgi:hypothetical protein